LYGLGEKGSRKKERKAKNEREHSNQKNQVFSVQVFHPDPVRPPGAPVFAIRVRASCRVVHAMEVPGLFTSGRAAHINPELHWVMANFPPTH